jgi:hypothetical protein
MSAQRRRKISDASRLDRWRAYTPLLIGALLLTASWAVARWAPIRRVPEYEVEEVSVGIDFLVAGALPWAIHATRPSRNHGASAIPLPHPPPKIASNVQFYY